MKMQKEAVNLHWIAKVKHYGIEFASKRFENQLRRAD